ncbi:sensor histidine kinase [Diplocloster modestus]|uniref:Histidine kinase n=1 Tax=Diplocloster modestus TaxID=2850322 RepID=A0ABS6K4I9_9FIRM|nr:histidine kinase [Diplocloster modestus]MBU9725403.1 histidine kinase [Diplocloster modestus]
MKRHFTSIRYEFIFSMTALFLLFSSIVLSIWYSELKHEAQTTALQNAEHVLQVSNTLFENQVRDMINVAALTTVRSTNSLSTNILNILSKKDLSDSEIIGYRKSATDYLISLCSFKKNLNGLMVSDFKGDNSISYGIPTSFEIMQENQWIDLIKDSNKKYIVIPPHYPHKWFNTKKDLAFSVLEPVLAYSGEKIGFVSVDISAQLFQECFDTSSSSPSSLYVINKTDGEVLFSPTLDILDMARGESALPAIIRNLKSEKGYFYISDKNSGKLLVVYNTSALTGWTTLSVIPEKEIVLAFTNTSHKILLITLIIGIALILCIFLVTTFLTRKIRLLTSAVKNINGDCLDLPIEITSQDEIGSLFLQFKAMLDRIRGLLKAVKTEEAAKRKAEISALQFQMNPHFLYNSLNTIKFLANIQGIHNIGRVAESLSSLMHISMDDRAFLPVQEDIHFLRSYLEIQNYRYTNSFDFQLHYSEEIMDCYIPKLFIQPLAENSLKHGLVNRTDGGILLVEYLADENNLKVIVEDNGCGITDDRIQEIMHKNQNRNAGHIGIYNIRERIHLYFGEDYDLEIISQPGLFTRFEMTLPIVVKDEVENYV